jgi:hypothetical protein
VKQEKIINQEGRKITTTYTLENNYRVKLSTYHSANYKAIRTTLSECITGTSGIFTTETFMMFQDYNKQVISEPAARYSFKLLEDQHARAIELAAQEIALLLAQGEAGERECQQRQAA